MPESQSTSIRTAPCEWPIIVPTGCDSLAELDDAEPGETLPEGVAQVTSDDVIEAATAYLWQWTRRLFGLCEVTVRPCREDCTGTTYGGRSGIAHAGGPAAWSPVLLAGQWHNIACATCGTRCSCTHVPAITLPGPVDSILAVTIDDEPLDPTAYRVDGRTELVRTDGEDWPRCNDLAADDGPGTWSVRYRWGVPVPKGGQIAAGVLACEMAKALRGRECDLPQRVQTITREGVTVGVLDVFEGLEAGNTGLWQVDSWVRSQTEPPARSTVHVPRGRKRPTATTYGGA